MPEFEEVKVDVDAVLGEDPEVGAVPHHGCNPGWRRPLAACPVRPHPVSSPPPAALSAPLLCRAVQEILVNVAPKKANWDLRRDIADKLTRLERRTQVCAHGPRWLVKLPGAACNTAC